MVEDIRVAEAALGEVQYGGVDGEVRIFRRSIFVTKDMKAGEKFEEHVNVRSIRPGNGLHSRHMSDVVGKTAKTDIAKGTPMDWSLLA